jgi:hypothetical protein
MCKITYDECQAGRHHEQAAHEGNLEENDGPNLYAAREFMRNYEQVLGAVGPQQLKEVLGSLQQWAKGGPAAQGQQVRNGVSNVASPLT